MSSRSPSGGPAYSAPLEGEGEDDKSLLPPVRYKFGKLNELVIALREWHGWEHNYWRAAAIALAVSCYLVTMSVPLSLTAQAIFGALVFAISLFIRRYSGTLFTLIMIVFSINASSRYLYWRVTETIVLNNWVDGMFAIILLLAEIYAWFVLLLGYAQTIWPLRRKPEPMPTDTTLWPTVDVYIPTYNESMKVVRPTVLAAMAIDWPRDKLNIYILDDGSREEFREFAESVGVGHLTRIEHKHAKAGNINAALKQTSGEFIAIFDCDHIAARSFLQMTMGWFLRDPKLGMVQTPHHFLSPDPFERNLGTFRRVPNEGELFYGLIQDGNDLWNATFFCGSCAVTRRSILLEVGGVAIETVTEDAHTALKMHRLGYNTAYISIPQAAGLATESLSIHVGQRIRWARGMAQIFRVDNPFSGKGLSLMQRVCYSNAMLHFFYGFPRMVFLLSPLSYLFFQAHIIHAEALAIAAYALPHLAHANVTNSRMQGEFRHSFWAELYESVLAWYIFRPTLVALISPKLGKFNVTSKGGLVAEEYFDWEISEPYLVMLALNIAGLLVGIVRLFWWNTFESDTVILNLLWTVYNLVILGASIAVATESRQVRNNHRVECNQKAMLKTSAGRSIVCRANDYSEGGLGLVMPANGLVPLDSEVRVSLFMGQRECVFPARVAFARDASVGVEFEPLDLQQQMDLVQCTLARADAWLDWSDNRDADHPLKGLQEILYHSMRGFEHLGHYLTKRVAGHFHGKPENVDLGLFAPQASNSSGLSGRLMRFGRAVMLRQRATGVNENQPVVHLSVHDLKASLTSKLGGLASAGRGLLLKPGAMLRARTAKR
ncbi:MAG: UDP-forming cellulose synthase catalytic subunit [Gallionella sp.]|jgi:cellulose synthase (UDP-forming)